MPLFSPSINRPITPYLTTCCVGLVGFTDKYFQTKLIKKFTTEICTLTTADNNTAIQIDMHTNAYGLVTQKKNPLVNLKGLTNQHKYHTIIITKVLNSFFHLFINYFILNVFLA